MYDIFCLLFKVAFIVMSGSCGFLNTPVHACNNCLLCNWLEQSVQSCKGMHGVGAGDLYLAAMDAIYAVNPNVLFFIEGTGQSGLADNWGDGLCTDASTISSYGISDPNPFFTTLMGKAYLAQVCICLFPLPAVSYYCSCIVFCLPMCQPSNLQGANTAWVKHRCVTFAYCLLNALLCNLLLIVTSTFA